MSDIVIASRLWRLYHPQNAWAATFNGLTPVALQEVAPIAEYLDPAHRSLDDRAWDLGRIRFFYDELGRGADLEPIDVDNVCDGGRIYPIPIVLDGHHRLIAAVLRRRRIRVEYGGRVDLLDYLKGQRRRPPLD